MSVKTEERHAQLELCIPYVFGRLNPGNRKQFEAHLSSGCEQCRTELAGLYEATALLPLLLRQEAPPSGLRQRILGRLGSKKPEQSQRRGEQRPQQPQREKPVTPALAPDRPWYLYVSIVLGAVLIVALVIFVNQLIGTTGSQEKKLSDQQGELKHLQETADVLQAPRLEMTRLVASVQGSASYGKVLWDPAKRQALLQTGNLPTQPEGKQYQFWILKEKKAYSVGVFDVTAEKPGTLTTLPLPVDDTKGIEGFSVTLEPKGGSPQPTTDPQLRGSVQ